jgi:hypothetical protein
MRSRDLVKMSNLSTAFLKAHQTKYQTDQNNHLIRCGYGAVCFA